MIPIPLWVFLSFLLLFFVLAVWSWRQHLRLRSWRLVFAGLSNAERILLMWPSLGDKPVKTISFSTDRAENGFARLHTGPMLLAKFPIRRAIDGQAALRELIESTR